MEGNHHAKTQLESSSGFDAICQFVTDGQTDGRTNTRQLAYTCQHPGLPSNRSYFISRYFILWAVVSAGYPALLSSSYFERINDDDDDDDDDKCLRDYDLVVAHC